ncbi:MAG: tetrahydromethanopterin S-methyltransferase subunit A [Desulfobacterales bacterium]|nr:tetrahydromethanopterin S-methyltransferase subunit A [Desulfobacterales bacterium]
MENLVAVKDCKILQLNDEDGFSTAIIQKKAPTGEMLKVSPVDSYPTEPGCFLRGNDFSPVAVVVLLNAPYGTLPPEVQNAPPEIEKLVRAAIETGAAISGTLQTENIGIEKIICNVVGNPNIRYLVLCGEEVHGHHSGTAVKALLANGINEKRTIIGSKAVTPYLFNIPLEAIDRFRKQVALVDLVGEMDPAAIIKAVWSCYQEEHTAFRDYMLYDPGAYSEPGISCTLTGRVKHPEEIEEWEIDEVLKEIEAAAAAVRPMVAKKVKPAAIQEEVQVEEKRGRVVIDEQKLIAVGENLAKIAEGLHEIAKILMGEAATRIAKPPREEVVMAPPGVEKVPQTEAQEMAARYFANHLKGYSGVLAVLEACDRDICHDGCTLPNVANSVIKRLSKLEKDLDGSSVVEPRKQVMRAQIRDFLARAEALPQNVDRPCQKTAGTCKIGSGCFASGALKMMKLITEPPSPTQ